MKTNHTVIVSWKSVVLLLVSAGLFVAGLLFLSQSQLQTAIGSVLEYPRPIAAVSATVGLGSSFEAPGQPVQLIIPAIGVDANIQSVGLSKTGNGSMGIPSNFTDVAWYNKGTLPGMLGSAVIDGHLDGKNVPRAVFYDLNKLQTGDLVEVRDSSGKRFQFQVVTKKIYDYDAPTGDIFSGDGSKARLNLITCGGDWIKSRKLYDKRIVIFTELMKTI